ncbi:MAG: DUF6794 domain-containing protein [Acidobacteriota bacterium]|nr:DUF6794 domain-containing protein [Acidobacteriota bacterium]
MRFLEPLLLVGVVLLACLACATQGPNPECVGVTVPYEGKMELDRTPDPGQEEGLLIPASVEEALAEMDRMLSEDFKRSLACGTAKDAKWYHLSLGRWMRNNWGLWGGGPLAEHFNELGIFHPDDMSGILVASYYRRLRGEPIRLEEQIRYYQEFWAAHLPPEEEFVCPGDDEPAEEVGSWEAQRPPEPWIVYHVFECEDGRLWEYEHNQGWSPASEETLRQFGEEVEAPGDG